jgi:hypothetical protein
LANELGPNIVGISVYTGYVVYCCVLWIYLWKRIR